MLLRCSARAAEAFGRRQRERGEIGRDESSRDLLLQFAGAAPPLPAKIGGTTAYFFLRQHRLDHELGWGRKLYLASWPANAALWLSSLPEACRAEACPCGRARAVATLIDQVELRELPRVGTAAGEGSWGGELGTTPRFG